MKVDARRYFASLVELSRDSGPIGQVLRRYPEWMLRAADKWAEQDFDYQKKHQDQNRLPLLDPWQFMLCARAVSSIDKAVFRAAQSQLPALRHLIHIAEGIATLKTDWYQVAVNAQAKGDKRGFNHAMRKILNGHVLKERVQRDVAMQNNPELTEQIGQLQKARRTQLVHRGERDKIEQLKQWPSWKEFGRNTRLPVVLVEWWVRCGVNGVPGMMFWRNEALTKFLKVYLDQTNLPPETVKKTRQQLGLIPVSEKKYIVRDFSITTKSSGDREIRGFWRNGQQSFRGVIFPQKQISEAVMTAFGSA